MPDYFEVDNSQVVIFSPMQLFKDGKADDAQISMHAGNI